MTGHCAYSSQHNLKTKPAFQLHTTINILHHVGRQIERLPTTLVVVSHHLGGVVAVRYKKIVEVEESTKRW